MYQVRNHTSEIGLLESVFALLAITILTSGFAVHGSLAGYFCCLFLPRRPCSSRSLSTRSSLSGNRTLTKGGNCRQSALQEFPAQRSPRRSEQQGLISPESLDEACFPFPFPSTNNSLSGVSLLIRTRHAEVGICTESTKQNTIPL